jgi:hypothetical protein
MAKIVESLRYEKLGRGKMVVVHIISGFVFLEISYAPLVLVLNDDINREYIVIDI